MDAKARSAAYAEVMRRLERAADHAASAAAHLASYAENTKATAERMSRDR